MNATARIAAAAQRTPSRWPSIAEGVGWGDVNPVTVQWGGSVVSNERRHASVIEDVPFGFMRSMLMAFVEDPVTEGRDGEMMRECYLIFLNGLVSLVQEVKNSE
jgi:hypothetical protein